MKANGFLVVLAQVKPGIVTFALYHLDYLPMAFGVSLNASVKYLPALYSGSAFAEDHL
jgi:hypothetical protein